MMRRLGTAVTVVVLLAAVAARSNPLGAQANAWPNTNTASLSSGDFRNSRAFGELAHDQVSGGSKVQRFLNAINAGHLTGAGKLTTPDFSLTLVDGTQAAGADALNLLASLNTPVTTVSLSAANQSVSGVLQFGNDPQVNVTFMGANRLIASMALSAITAASEQAGG
ncbi:MAG: hypothetical protein ACR2PL_18735, partial [Dehalococcoidia bacterium]